MPRFYSTLVVLILSITGCGSTSVEEANLRAAVEAEELQDQLHALTKNHN